MNKIDEGILKLMFGGSGCKQYNKDPSNGYLIPSDNTNIPLILKQFKNIKTINIKNTQDIMEGKYYSLSLFSLLTLLKPQSAVKELRIMLLHGRYSGLNLKDSWISFMWNNTDISSLKQKYENNGYSIQCQLDDEYHLDDEIVIKKL